MPINKTVAVALVDDPDDAMRTEMDEEKLQELMDQIQADGLTNPIAVEKVGNRYKVIAGHRRIVAHRRLKKETIEVRDYTGEQYDADSIKFGENFGREDISDADAAIWLAEMVEKKNYGSERLMAITKKSEPWINARLSLFRGDQLVFEALRQGKINLGTATELNRFPDDFRPMYLDICINTTPPIFLVRDWREKLKLQQMQQGQEQPAATDPTVSTIVPGVIIECCEICRGTELIHVMKFYRIHEHCFRMITQALNEQAKG